MNYMPVASRDRFPVNPSKCIAELHGSNGHKAAAALEIQKLVPSVGYLRRPTKPASTTESNEFGWDISKKSFDMALRHMDIQQGMDGKDAFIVCENVIVPHVVQIAIIAALQCSGQKCVGAERSILHPTIYSTFVAQIVKLVKSVLVGPPLARRYDMGAICMQEYADKLQNFVNGALEKGTEIASRGSYDDYLTKLMQEEAFQPIIPIMKSSYDGEAIKLANDSSYGFGCTVFSGSQKRAIEITLQLQCGVTTINDFASTYRCQSLPLRQC